MAPNASEDRQKPKQPRIDEIDRQEMDFRIPRGRLVARKAAMGTAPRRVVMNARRAVIAAREEETTERIARAQETTEAGERQGDTESREEERAQETTEAGERPGARDTDQV